MIESILLMVVAYLLGSVSSAVITCKIFKLPDPRSTGSHNPGATNVLRIGGKSPAIITLIGDALKGAVPALLAIILGKPAFIAAIVLLCAFLGHLYPIFFKFKGGKGIATLIGGLLIVSWIVGVLFISTWLITFALSRISSVSALTAVALTPIFAYLNTDLITTGIITVICILTLHRHKDNITRIITHKETKI